MKYRFILFTAALLCFQTCYGAPERKKKSRPTQSARSELIYRSNGVYSLLEAAACGNLEVMQARISEGCNVNQQDELGNTALHLAAMAGQQNAVQLLLKSGASTGISNKSGKTARDCATSAVRSIIK